MGKNLACSKERSPRESGESFGVPHLAPTPELISRHSILLAMELSRAIPSLPPSRRSRVLGGPTLSQRQAQSRGPAEFRHALPISCTFKTSTARNAEIHSLEWCSSAGKVLCSTTPHLGVRSRG